MRTIKFLITIGFLATIATPVAAQSGIGWLADWRAARDLSQQQNRPVLLHFWSSTCVPCKQLERNVFSRSDVARAVSGYVAVKINVEQSPQLAQFYEVESVPTDIIVDPNGKILVSNPSPHDPNQYISMLDSVKASYYSGLDVSRVARSGGSPMPQSATFPSNNGQPAGGSATRKQLPSPGGRNSVYGGSSPSQGPTGFPQSQKQAGVNSPLSTNPAQRANVSHQYANPFGGQSNPSQAGERNVQWNQHIGGNPSAPGNYGSSNPGAGAAVGGAPSQNYSQGSPTGNGQAGIGSPGWSQQTPVQPSVTPQSNTQPGFGNSGFTVGNQAAAGQPSAGRPQSSPAGPQVGLDGYCPVSLVEQHSWANGDQRWGAKHRGRVYLFASQVNQQRFFSNPDAYSPVLSGYDAVRYGELGQLVDGRREHGLIFGNQYYLFSDEAALERFRSSPQRYVAIVQQAMRQTADQQQAR